MTEVYGGLNMNEEETTEFVFELLGGPPGSPVDGRAYVDTTADAFRVRINGEWLEFTIGAAVVDLAANRPVSADAGDFFFASDTDLLSIWDGAAWVDLDYAAVSHTHAAGDVTSGTFANARIGQASVTQHQAALTITESQISDLGSYSATGHAHAAGDISSGALADARVAQTNVTQHQAALSITESQISDLGAYYASGDDIVAGLLSATADATTDDILTVTGFGAHTGAYLKAKNAGGESLVEIGEIFGDAGIISISDNDVEAGLLYATSLTDFVIRQDNASGKGSLNDSSNDIQLQWDTSGVRANGVASQHTIPLTVDGGGSAITSGAQAWTSVPFDCTITKWRILADVSGSAVIDVWVDTYANYPPLDADSIAASALPTLTTATKAESSTLTGWTTALSEGDIVKFNVDSASTVTHLVLELFVTPTWSV